MKSVAEVLNYKQKGKDMDEFIVVPLSEKLAYCFGDPALTLMYTMTSTLLMVSRTYLWEPSLTGHIPNMGKQESGS